MSVCADSPGVESLHQWFAQSPDHATYRSIEGGLLSVFREADGLSLPSSLLIGRLNLGAARRLAPAELLEGMRSELRRLRTASEVISRCERTPRGRLLLDGADHTNLVNTVSIYLSGGLSSNLLVAFLTETAPPPRTLDDLFRACAVLLKISLSGSFSEDELLRFGSALVNSSVTPAGYAAIGSFIVRASAGGRGGSGLLLSAEQILRHGGGLPQMELEIERRR